MTVQSQNEKESSLLFFLSVLFKYWKFLTGLYFLVGLITVATLLILPKWYKSEATIVILEDNASPMSGLLAQFNSFGLGLGGGTNIETYIEYINTAKLYDRIIEKFDLKTVYETNTREDTYSVIFNNLSVANNENGTFTISFAYKEDPAKAKEIVDYIIIELQKISLEVDKAQASNYRAYIEDYYNSTKESLLADEDSLVQFQKNTGILDLNTQLTATIEGIAELEKRRIQLEIEQNFLSEQLQNSTRLQTIDKELAAISDQLESLNTNSYIAILSIEKLPDLGIDYLRFRRDVEIGTQVSEFLRLQYEQALLDEQKISSDLYVLDPPQEAEKRFKPQRTRLLVIVMFFTLITSLLGIRAYEFIRTHKENLNRYMK